MGKMKKIGVCMAAVAGAAGIAGLSAKAVEGVRKKWFLRGFEAGQFIGSLTAAESFAPCPPPLAESVTDLPTTE